MKTAEITFPLVDPPSSPPTTNLLSTITSRQVTDVAKNRVTEKGRVPDGTL